MMIFGNIYVSKYKHKKERKFLAISWSVNIYLTYLALTLEQLFHHPWIARSVFQFNVQFLDLLKNVAVLFIEDSNVFRDPGEFIHLVLEEFLAV